MSKYTLDMDFSLLNGPKAHNWIRRFRDMADSAFAGKDNRSRLLGNLLIIEQYVNTLKIGLSADGKQSYEQISFAEIDDLLAFLTDASISMENIPLPSSTGADYSKAAEQVYQTALFQSMIERIQDSLKTALLATPEQYPELRAKYQERTIIPVESITKLMDFQRM